MDEVHYALRSKDTRRRSGKDASSSSSYSSLHETKSSFSRLRSRLSVLAIAGYRMHRY